MTSLARDNDVGPKPRNNAVRHEDRHGDEDVRQLSTSEVETLTLALERACVTGQLSEVAWLMEHTTLREKMSTLRQALLLASRWAQWHVIKWLLVHIHIDSNLTDNNGNTILHTVISGRQFIDNQLLRCSFTNNMTGLCRSVFVNKDNVNVQDTNEDTPLHHACNRGNSDAIGILLLAGANETLTNNNGQTPVQIAVIKKRWRAVELLDTSNRWKVLIRSHRLRRRTAMRVMMTLVKWKVEQVRCRWTRAIVTLHTIMGLARSEKINNSLKCCFICDALVSACKAWRLCRTNSNK